MPTARRGDSDGAGKGGKGVARFAGGEGVGSRDETRDSVTAVCVGSGCLAAVGGNGYICQRVIVAIGNLA